MIHHVRANLISDRNNLLDAFTQQGKAGTGV